MATNLQGRTAFARRRNKSTITTIAGQNKKNYPITLVGDGAPDVPTPRQPLSPYNSEIITNSKHGRTLFTPTDIRDSLFLRKIAPLFAYLHCAQGQKGGADFILRFHFYLIFDFYMLFFIKSAPCRLAPNEALPQTPLGALPLDPTSPLAPGLSVRFISRFARCLGAALPIPHSSLNPLLTQLLLYPNIIQTIHLTWC